MREVLAWCIGPLLIMVVVMRLLAGRHIVLVVPSLLLLASYSITILPWRRVITAVALGWSVLAMVILLLSPLRYWELLKFFAIAQADFGQYVGSWPSGWGVAEAVEEIRRQTGSGRAIVLVRADSGNPEDGVAVYLARDKNILVLPLTVYQRLAQIPDNTRRFFVSRGNQYAGLEKKFTEIAIYKKPLAGDHEFVGLYELSRPP